MPFQCREVHTEMPRLYHLPTRFLLAGRVVFAAPASAESRKLLSKRLGGRGWSTLNL